MIPGPNTPMSYIPIRFPIWNGGQRVVGIADFRVKQHNKIEIEYVRKDGTRSYPNCYYMAGADIVKYPVQTVKGGVRVYLVPLKDLEEILPDEQLHAGGEESGTSG